MNCSSCGYRAENINVDSEGNAVCDLCAAHWAVPRFAMPHAEKILFHRIQKLMERVAVLEKTTLREQM